MHYVPMNFVSLILNTYKYDEFQTVRLETSSVGNIYALTSYHHSLNEMTNPTT